jgi:hypothetical protein
MAPAIWRSRFSGPSDNTTRGDAGVRQRVRGKSKSKARRQGSIRAGSRETRDRRRFLASQVVVASSSKKFNLRHKRALLAADNVLHAAVARVSVCERTFMPALNP